MEKNNWMSHAEFVVIFITLLGGLFGLNNKIENQSNRTDRLYEMWCATQQEIKDLRIDMMKEYYELKNR